MGVTFNPFSGRLQFLSPTLTSPLLFKGSITVAADFPTSATVQSGWFYIILATVTDNDPTKTNTGQSFSNGDEIVWNGSNWTLLGNSLTNHASLSNLGFSASGHTGFYGTDQSTPQTISGQVKSIPSAETQVGQIIQGHTHNLASQTPTQIGSIAWWFKADAETYNDNDAVGTLTDQSGNNRHATQSTASNKPTFKTNILNGLSAYYFDGNDELSQSGTANNVQTVIAVASYTAGTGSTWDHIVGLMNGSRYIYGVNGGNTLITGGSQAGNYWVNNVAGATYAPMATAKIWSGLWNASQSNNYTFGRLDNTTKYWTGYIFEIVAFTKVLTDTERNQVETYLKDKWNITAMSYIPVNQTADLAQWKDPTGTVLTYIDKDGNLVGKNVTASKVLTTQTAVGANNVFTTTLSISSTDFETNTRSLIDLNNNATAGSYYGTALSFSKQGVVQGVIGINPAAGEGISITPLGSNTKIRFGNYTQGNSYWVKVTDGSWQLGSGTITGLNLTNGTINNVAVMNMYSGYGASVRFSDGWIANYSGLGFYTGTTAELKAVNSAYRMMTTNVNGYMDQGINNAPFFKRDRAGFGVSGADDMLARVHAKSAMACGGEAVSCGDASFQVGNCTGTRNCSQYDEADCATHSCTQEYTNCTGTWGSGSCYNYGDEGSCNSIGGCYWDGDSCEDLCAQYNYNEGGCTGNPACQWDGMSQCTMKYGNCAGYNGDSSGCTSAHCTYGGFSACTGDGGDCPSFSSSSTCLAAYGTNVCSWSHDACEGQDGCDWIATTCSSQPQETCTGACTWITCSNYGNENDCNAQTPCSWNAGTSCSAFSNHDDCVAQSPCDWACGNCNIWNNDETECTNHSTGQYCGNCTWTAASGSCNETNYCDSWDNDPSGCGGQSHCSYSQSQAFSCTDNAYCDTWENDESNCLANGCLYDNGNCYYDCGSLGAGDCQTASTYCTYTPEVGDCYNNISGGCSSQSAYDCQNTYTDVCSWSGTDSSCAGSYDTGSCTGNYGAGCEGSDHCTGDNSHCGGTATTCVTYESESPCESQDGCTWGELDAYYGEGAYNTTKGYKLQAIADSVAENDMLFKGSDHSNKLCYKDSGGSVHVLY